MRLAACVDQSARLKVNQAGQFVGLPTISGRGGLPIAADADRHGLIPEASPSIALALALAAKAGLKQTQATDGSRSQAAGLYA